MRRVLADLDRSGLSVVEFARRQGLSPGALSWWRHVARRRAEEGAGKRHQAPRSPKARAEFVEVRAEPDSGNGATVDMADAFEVLVPGGCLVRVRGDFDATALRRLVTALGARC